MGRWIRIKAKYNAYGDAVQGLVNQPPTVVRLVSKAYASLGIKCETPTQAEAYDRLFANAPRVAVIGGSSDHLAHITDDQTIAAAVAAVWEQGGVPFSFGIPVMCDGTAQAHLGMSYSLFTRNLSAEFVASQMESHAYHAAIVLQGCDKTPFGVACGLAAIDQARIRRGEPPVWATFIPGHVLKGGTLPPATREALEALARNAERAQRPDLAADLRSSMEFVVQCTSTEAYMGVLQRFVEEGLLKESQSAGLRRQLATCACHADGGICAFNGTGNSSRLALAALGLVHPAVELLSKPPSQAQIADVVAGLFKTFNKEEYSVSRMARANWANVVYVHGATGGSTNLTLHLVALGNYAGVKTAIETYDETHRAGHVPDMFDFSLTEDRTHYELARQCETGQIRGLETLFHELGGQGVAMNFDAPTVTGASWAARLKNKRGLPASGAKGRPIILSSPRRPRSGVDVLTGNFFDSAVVKSSGMTDEQLVDFDDKLHFVVYFSNEETATDALLDPEIDAKLLRQAKLSKQALLTMLAYNAPQGEAGDLEKLNTRHLYAAMVESGALKFAMVIGGQGPVAFGMPEMFAPMQHINSNRRLRKITTLVSDGRYSGVSYGAAIGHVTPEAACGGGILYLKTGDVLRLWLSKRTLDVMDAAVFAKGKVKKAARFPGPEREALAKRRLKEIERRRTRIAALCLQDVTSAATGVIPKRVWENVQKSR